MFSIKKKTRQMEKIYLIRKRTENQSSVMCVSLISQSSKLYWLGLLEMICLKNSPLHCIPLYHHHSVGCKHCLKIPCCLIYFFHSNYWEIHQATGDHIFAIWKPLHNPPSPGKVQKLLVIIAPLIIYTDSIYGVGWTIVEFFRVKIKTYFFGILFYLL